MAVVVTVVVAVVVAANRVVVNREDISQLSETIIGRTEEKKENVR